MYFLIVVKKYIALATTKIYCQRECYMSGRLFSGLELALARLDENHERTSAMSEERTVLALKIVVNVDNPIDTQPNLY